MPKRPDPASLGFRGGFIASNKSNNLKLDSPIFIHVPNHPEPEAEGISIPSRNVGLSRPKKTDGMGPGDPGFDAGEAAIAAVMDARMADLQRREAAGELTDAELAELAQLSATAVAIMDERIADLQRREATGELTDAELAELAQLITTSSHAGSAAAIDDRNKPRFDADDAEAAVLMDERIADLKRREAAGELTGEELLQLAELEQKKEWHMAVKSGAAASGTSGTSGQLESLRQQAAQAELDRTNALLRASSNRGKRGKKHSRAAELSSEVKEEEEGEEARAAAEVAVTAAAAAGGEDQEAAAVAARTRVATSKSAAAAAATAAEAQAAAEAEMASKLEAENVIDAESEAEAEAEVEAEARLRLQAEASSLPAWDELEKLPRSYDKLPSPPSGPSLKISGASSRLYTPTAGLSPRELLEQRRRQRQADSQVDDGYTSRGKLSALACVRAVQDLAQLRKQREDGGPLAVVSQLQCRLLSRHAQKLRLAGHNDRQCITMVHRDVRRLTQLCVAYVNAPKSAPIMSSLEGSITRRPSTSPSRSPSRSRLASRFRQVNRLVADDRPSTSPSMSRGSSPPRTPRPGAAGPWRNWQEPPTPPKTAPAVLQPAVLDSERFSHLSLPSPRQRGHRGHSTLSTLPGPGSYSPTLAHKPSSPSFSMADRVKIDLLKTEPPPVQWGGCTGGTL